MSNSPLSQYQMIDYMPVVFDKLMEELSIPPPYVIIYQANQDFCQKYQTLATDVSDPYSISTISNQIKQGYIDDALKKLYYVLDANFRINSIEFNQFRQLFLQKLITVSKMDSEVIKQEIAIFDNVTQFCFGNVHKSVQQREFEVTDERLAILYPQVVEAYERVLLWIEDKNKSKTIAEKAEIWRQIKFYENEEELAKHYDKNRSMLEAVYLVQKIENISVMTRFFSENANIDVGTLVKESLVNWRNEYSELTREAREEKKRLKEEAKKKQIVGTEKMLELLYHDIVPRFLQKKNLKTILMEIKNKCSNTKDKVELSTLMKAMLPVEQDFIDVLYDNSGETYYKNISKNQFEDKPLVYFAILYKALIENQIDFLYAVIKNREEHYLLRLGARKLLLFKMMQNCRVKNPMGASRVMNAFLSSYEKIILEPKEPLKIRKDTLVKLSCLVIPGLPDLGDHFDTDLVDMFIKVYTEVLDVNLVIRFSNLKKLSDVEHEELELLKEGVKWYEVIVREIGRRENKSRDQNRRNDLLLSKIERKLSGNVKKIQTRSVILK